MVIVAGNIVLFQAAEGIAKLLQGFTNGFKIFIQRTPGGLQRGKAGVLAQFFVQAYRIFVLRCIAQKIIGPAKKGTNLSLHRAERTIAERLMRLANGTLPWPWIDPEKALPWVEKHIGLAFAESQVAAIRLALKSKVLVITGGPGVGKTTIVRGILRIVTARASTFCCAHRPAAPPSA